MNEAGADTPKKLSRANTSSLQAHILPLITLALLALAAGLIATWNGVSYGHDGGSYLTYAREIEQDGLLRLNNSYWHELRTASWLDAWPPLYPMILAVGGVVGIDPIPWARVISVASLLAAALLTYYIGWTILKSKVGAWAAAALFVAVPSTTGAVFGLAHSESVFTVMLLGIVWLLLSYPFGDATASNRAALWAALIAAFTLITRYIALGAVIGAGLYLLLWARTVRRPRRWWPALFFVLSLGPLGLWAFYLRGMTGSFTGAQITTDAATFEHIPESLRQIAVELLHGFGTPTRLLGLQSNWWALGVAGLFFVRVVVLLWRKRVPLARSFHSPHLLLALVSGVYIAAYWALAVRSQWIIADWRHYVPVYPLVFILVIQMVLWARVPRWLNAVVVALFLVSGAQAVVKNSDGFYWNRPSWRASESLAHLPDLVRPGALVHANETPYLLLRLGLDATARIFGGDAGFREYACSDLTYPEDFPYAVFVVIDTPYLREIPPDEAADFFRAWAEPCGTVESVVNDSFLAVTTVRLNGR